MVTAEFIGFQFGFRLYNIIGDHPRTGSTVSVKTLVEEGIDIPDLPPEEVFLEYRKIENMIRKAA